MGGNRLIFRYYRAYSVVDIEGCEFRVFVRNPDEFSVWDEIRQRQYRKNLIWYEGEPVGYA